MRKSLITFALTLALMLVSVGIKAQTVYLNEGFEGETWGTTATGTIPSNWDKQDYTPGPTSTTSIASYLWYVSTTATYVHSGSKAMYLLASYSYTSASRLKTPAMTFSQTKDVMVSFWLRNGTAATAQGDFSLYYSLDGGTTYLTNPIVEHVNTGNVWTYYQFRLPSSLRGQTVTLVFQGASGASTSYYYGLDDVVVKDAPTCQAPRNLSISNLTGSTADLNWSLDTMGVTPDQFSVTLMAEDSTVISYNPAVTIYPVSFSGLQANTTYLVSVRSNCDVQSYQGYSDSLFTSFTTLPPAINPPFFENFDTLAASTFPPAGYYLYKATLNTSATYSYGGSGNSVKLTTTKTDYAYIVFPLMNVVANNFEVDFMIRRAAAQNATNKAIRFSVGYITDPADVTGSFVSILYDSIEGDNSWRNYRCNSALVQDQTTPLMVCLFVEAGYATSVYLDNVNVHLIPSCPRPEHLTCSDITDTTVTLSWDMANAPGYVVRVTDVATSAETVLTTSQNPFTVTGLTPNTSYQFTVQGVCSATDSSDVSMPATAKTYCTVADTVLFIEGAEGTSTANPLPDCWVTDYISNPSGSSVAPFQSATTQKIGTRSFSIPYKATGTISYFCSQARNFDMSGKYSFRFSVYRPSATSSSTTYPGEAIKIFVTPTPGDTTNAVEVIPAINFTASLAPVTTTIGWNQYEGVINYQGTGYVMAVMYSKNGIQRYIDNLEVFLTPQCVKVTDITTGNVGSTTYDLAWTPGMSETQWVVDYMVKKGTTVVLDTTEVLSSAQLMVQNLLPATSYTLTGNVRALCGVGDTSEAVAFSRSFKTNCAALNTLPYFNDFEGETTGTTTSKTAPACWNQFNDATNTYIGYPYVTTSTTYATSGTKYMHFYTNLTAAYAEHEMSILPEIDTTVIPINTLRLRFWAKRSTTTTYVDAPMIIGVMTDPADLTTFVPVDTVVVNNTAATQYIAYLDRYVGNGTFIAIRLDRQSTICYCYLDDVTLEEIPNCIDLEGSATINDISESSVTLTIDDLTATSGWSYAYDLKGTPVAQMTPVDTMGASITLQSLTPATAYDLYVRRNCGSGEYSPWSSKISFSTTAIPATAPYYCGFEDATENASWMTVTGADTTCKFAVGTVSTAVHTGSQSIYVSNDNGTSNAYTASTTSRNYAYRTIHFDAKGYQIEFFWRCPGGEGTATVYDYGRVMLIPASETLTSGSSGTNVTAANAQAGFPTSAIFLNPDTANNLHLAGDGWHFISKFVNFTNAPGNYNLVLAWNKDGSGGTTVGPLAIDDITITELTCIPPVEINTTVASTSATLSVNQPGSSEWEFIVDTVAFTKQTAPANPKFRISSTDGTASVAGLNPNTEYFYSVRTICGVGDTSAWLDPASLRTFCAAYAVPYTEGFEETGAAYCWTMQSEASDASIGRTTTYKKSGDASLQVVKALAISPEYTVDSLTLYMVNGYAYSTADSAQFAVGVIVDPNDATTFQPITTVTLPAKSTWTEFTSYFTLLSDPDYAEFKYARHIGFASTDNTIYYDNIMVDLTPTCPKPNEIEITNISTNSFDISFTDNANASQWVVYTNGTPHVINATNATISGLTAHTLYTVGVAAVCSATDTSYVAEAGTITTVCDKIATPWSCGFESTEGYVGGSSHNVTTNLTVNAENNCWNVLNNRPATSTSGYPYAYVYTTAAGVHSGSQGTYMYSSTSGRNLCLIFPEFSEPVNNMKVDFWYKNSSTGTTSPQLKFGYFTDPTVDTSFVAVETLTRLSAWTEAEFLTNTAGYNIPSNARLGLMIERGTASGTVYVDDINVTLLRSCSDPETPSAFNVTASSVDIAIADTAAAHTSWQYVYGPSGFDPNLATPVTVTTDTFTISGLTDDSNYEVYVRAVCGTGDYSNYVKTSFRTLCVPFYVTETTPFSEDFNNYNYNQYLNSGTCYTVLNEPTTNSYWAKAYPTAIPSATATTYYFYGHSADRYDKCLYWYIYKTQFEDGSVVRPFHLDGGTTYEVSAWVRNSTTTSYQSLVSALMGTSTTALDTMASLVIDGATTTARPVAGVNTYCYNELYQQIKFFVTPDTTGDYFIGYNVAINNTSSYTYLYLDDWTVRVFHGCQPATAEVDSVTARKAYISIADTSYYQFEYVLNDTTLAPTLLDTTHFMIDSLTPATAYTLYLRKYCDTTTYSPWYPASFRTDCSALQDLPYTNDFENEATGTTTAHTAPVCWSQYNDATTTTVGYPYVYSSTTYSHSGSKSLYFYTTTTTTYAAHEMSILPPVDTAMHPINTLRLTFWAKRSTTTTYADAPMIIGVMSDPTDISTFVPVETVLVSNTTHQLFKVSMANYTGNGTYIAIRLDRQSAVCYCYVDDVTLEEIPPCEAPEDAPVVVSTTMTTLTVSADMARKDSIEFGIAAYRPNITSAAIDTTLYSTDGNGCFTGLDGSKQYYVWYRYLCGVHGISGWSPLASGTTMATDCFDPQNLRTVGMLNDHHAEITWGKAPDAIGYQYELRQNNTLIDSAVNMSDTIVYDSLAANTQYTFRVRTFCASDTSAWQTITFRTTHATFTLPFITGFEDDTQNLGWNFNTLSASLTNSLMIGTGTQMSGNNSMYVSNDNSTFSYTTGASVSEAEILLEIPAGGYYVSYDWICKGESSYDFGRFFLVPASVTVTGTTHTAFNTSLPTCAISLEPNGARLNLSDAWGSYSDIVTVPTTGVYKMVVVWCNDASVTNLPPFAIDNIRFEAVSCMPLNSVTMLNVNSYDAKALVSRFDSAAVEYALSLYDVEDSLTWSVATNDTLSFTGLIPATEYYLFARHACDSVTKSPAKRVSFTTPSNSVQLPFLATFESGDTLNGHWIMTGAANNTFAIGNGVAYTGSNSLYISDDGSTHHYSGAAVAWSYAYIPVQFPAGSFDVSYQWTCHGESTFDYGHLFLVPASMIPQDNTQFGSMTASVLPPGAIALDADFGKLNSTDSLNNVWFDGSAEIILENGGTYNLVVAWHNDASVFHQPPLAIDNIRIKQLTCPKPDVTKMSMDSSSTDMFRVKVGGAKPGSTILYHVATDISFTDTIAFGETAVNDSLVTVTGLSAATWYYARVWFNCGDGDTSSVEVVRIRTNCGIVTTFPYVEDFENYVANSTYKTVLDENCWNTQASSTTAYYYVSATASYVHGGAKALYAYNGATVGTTQLFAMPRVDTLAGKTLSLWYKNYSTSYNANYAVVEVGYLSNPTDASTFVNLYTAPYSSSYTQLHYDYASTIPANARPAFRTHGTYTVYLDDIRLSKVVQGSQYYDTICFGSAYNEHGFSCPAGSLAPGDTTLNAIIRATQAGESDSITTVHLYVRPEIVNIINDTTCAGQPYSRGIFTFDSPQTGTYFRTGTSVTGCDSTVTLNLYVCPTQETRTDTICQGDAYQLGTQTITTPGVHVGYITNKFGCTDTVTLYLTVIDTASLTVDTICQGDSYVFEGNVYTQAGRYVVPTTGARGCPVNKTLLLTVIKSDSVCNVSFCQGGYVTIADTVITTPGVYSLRRATRFGCTVSFYITATQISPTPVDVYDDACENKPYYGHGISGILITCDTMIVTTHKTAAGCDSIENVHLTYNTTIRTYTRDSIAEGEIYIWNGFAYSTDTIDSVVTPSLATGCDSIDYLILTIKGGGSAVENVADVHMSIVPNPVNAGATALVYGEFGEIEKVEILNNFGQLVETFVPETYPIEVSGISVSGLYYVRVTTRSGSVHLQKLMVK